MRRIAALVLLRPLHIAPRPPPIKKSSKTEVRSGVELTVGRETVVDF
jgi:hypothetical protein